MLLAPLKSQECELLIIIYAAAIFYAYVDNFLKTTPFCSSDVTSHWPLTTRIDSRTTADHPSSELLWLFQFALPAQSQRNQR